MSRSAARGASKRGSSYVPSRSAGADAYTRKRKSRKRKVVLRGVLIGILCVLLAGGGALAMYIGGINNQLTMGLDSSTKELLADSVQYDDPFYMLLLGVDKSQERMDSAEYGEADSNYRSDSCNKEKIHNLRYGYQIRFDKATHKYEGPVCSVRQHIGSAIRVVVAPLLEI